MRDIVALQRSFITAAVSDNLLDNGISISSPRAKTILESALVKASGKPIFKANYVHGDLNPSLYNDQLKDLELDLQVLLAATSDLDAAISTTTILSDVEHVAVSNNLEQLAIITAYLKQGQLTFTDTFATPEYVDLSQSTASIDTVTGSIRHKSSIAKTLLPLKDTRLVFEPLSRYTAASALTPISALSSGTQPFTTIYQADSNTGFSTTFKFNLPSGASRLLLFRSAAGYYEITVTFNKGEPYVGMLGTTSLSIPVDDLATEATIILRRPSPDIEEDSSAYYVFSLYPILVCALYNNRGSTVVSKPIAFNDLSNNKIALHSVAVISKYTGQGLVKAFIAPYYQDQLYASSSWVEVPIGTAVRLSDTYDGVATPSTDSLIELNSNELQILQFETLPTKVNVVGGIGAVAGGDGGVVYRTSIRGPYSGVADLFTLGPAGGQTYYLPIPYEALGLKATDVLPQTGAIYSLRVWQHTYSSVERITYEVDDTPGNQRLLIKLPSSPFETRLPTRIKRPVSLRLNEETVAWALELKIAELSEDNTNKWMGYIDLAAGEVLTITPKSGIITTIDRESGIIVQITSSTKLIGPTRATIHISGGGLLPELLSIDDPTKIRAFDVVKQTNYHPLPGEFVIFDKSVVVGNPCNANIYSLSTGTQYTLEALQKDAAAFYKIEYNIIDESVTAVRLKFELMPLDGDPSFALTEYTAAFQPVLAADYMFNDVSAVASSSITSTLISKTGPIGTSAGS